MFVKTFISGVEGAKREDLAIQDGEAFTWPCACAIETFLGPACMRLLCRLDSNEISEAGLLHLIRSE